MAGWNNKVREELPEYDKAKADRGEYSKTDLEGYADQMLRAAAAEVDTKTGKQRGIGGDHPILFPEHEYARKRREIYTESGTPDPSLVAGIYNRTHPQGRKVNSKEQRQRNGASYYR